MEGKTYLLLIALCLSILFPDISCISEKDSHDQYLTCMESISVIEDKLKSNDVEIAKLRTQIASQKEEIKDLTNLQRLQDSPFSYTCGYQLKWGTWYQGPEYGIVSYSNSLFSMENDQWGYGLNLGTGMYTSQYPGVYMVSWTFQSLDSIYSGDEEYKESNGIYLYKNGERIEETYVGTFGQNGEIRETGGRTLFIRLEVDDNIHIHCEHCLDIRNIIFCVKLDKPDNL